MPAELLTGAARDRALLAAQRVLLQALAGGELSWEQWRTVHEGLAALLGEAEWPELAASPTIPALTQHAPALDRWRRAVIGDARRRAPLEVAAAWELTALECEAAGELDGALSALAAARAALAPRPRALQRREVA